MQFGENSPTGDTRKAARYVVGAPVTFAWVDGGQKYVGEGVTRNMSADGVYIWSQDAPPLGTAVQCHVFLQELTVDALPVDLLVDGRNVRIEEHPKQHHLFGFVVLNERVAVTSKQITT